MKKLKKAISICLAITILALANIQGVSAASTTFTDIKTTDWYYIYVNKLAELKITSGIGNNKYGPNNSVTRAEFVTFLCKALGHEQEDGYKYTDTTKHWSSKWISAAITAKIIDEGTKFNPNAAITRQEAVEMLCRSLSILKDTTMTTPYTDIKTDSGYSNTAYKEYLMQGSITNSKRYFYPSSDLKRSEVAAVIVNLVDYKANPAIYKAAKIAEIAQKEQKDNEVKAEAERYAAWKESVKGINTELLKNTDGLYKTSVYESNKYLRTETEYLKNWGAKNGMTEDEFSKEMVRVGSKFMNTWYNASYLEIDTLKTDLDSILENNAINNTLQKNLDYVKNNKFVSEGKFITSEGMLLYADWGNPVLRGTIKYRYLKPTSANVLNSEIVKSTGKPIQLGVWYEQDYEISFYSETDGIKTTSMHHISDIRISK